MFPLHLYDLFLTKRTLFHVVDQSKHNPEVLRILNAVRAEFDTDQSKLLARIAQLEAQVAAKEKDPKGKK